MIRHFKNLNHQKITFRIIKVDNVVNWILGLSLILVPDFFNRLFFGHEILSHWIYIAVGLGLVWFAAWQVETFLKPKKLEVTTLRFSAILAWLSVLALSAALFGLGGRMLLVSKIMLWLADLYMLLLGVWYWWVGE